MVRLPEEHIELMEADGIDPRWNNKRPVMAKEQEDERVRVRQTNQPDRSNRRS